MALDSDTVKELVEEIAGKDVVELVETIKDKKDVSEFKLAEKLKITVNQTRNMLYRLHSHNLVSFIRKKDKKKGWYIYYWTFHNKKAHELYIKIKSDKLNLLKERLKNESNNSYFACPNECVRLNLENSMEHDFKCPDCGTVLIQEDNSKRIKAIEKEIEDTTVKLAKPYVEIVRKAREKKETKKKTAKKTAVKKEAKKKTAKKEAAKKSTSKKTAKKTAKKKVAKKIIKKRIPNKK